MKKNEEKIETRKDEIKYVTSDPKKMLNKWLSKRVLKTWNETFVDESTGETCNIERNEVLFDRGMFIDQDLLAKIRFSMQAEEIKEVEVSNQKRMGFVLENTYLTPWTAQIQEGDKKHKFLLYASSIVNGVQILCDYVELKHTNGFTITQMKELDSCIILTDCLGKKIDKSDLTSAYLKDEIDMNTYIESGGMEEDKKDEPSKDEQTKFYQMDVNIIDQNDCKTSSTFIVNTVNVDRAVIVIGAWLDKQEQERALNAKKKKEEYEVHKFHIQLEKVAPIPIGEFIPRAFSFAYNDD